MENVSSDAGPGFAAQLSELVAPMQGAGSLLQSLAETLSATLSAAGGSAPTSATIDAGVGTTTQSPESSKPAGVAGFFEGLFASVNEQFSGFFTKLFGGGQDGEGLFGTLGGILGGNKKGEGKSEDGGADGTDKIKVASSEVADDQKKQDGERVKSDTKAWGSIIGNALSGSKKLRKIKKAAAIGSVIIDTATGIAKTFANLGFPAAIGPAAALAIAGAAQIATIKGQAHDGIKSIPSTGTYLLERGERVVDSRLNTDLSGFLNAQNAGANTSSTIANNNQSSSVTNAPVINLQIGSDVDENAVSSNRGAMETMIREIFADYAMEAPFG